MFRLKGGCLEPLSYRPAKKNGCGGRTRTFDSRINSAMPYQLGYATRKLLTSEAGRHESKDEEEAVNTLLSIFHLCSHVSALWRAGDEVFSENWLREQESNLPCVAAYETAESTRTLSRK
jgi:hypothetical protein